MRLWMRDRAHFPPANSLAVPISVYTSSADSKQMIQVSRSAAASRQRVLSRATQSLRNHIQPPSQQTRGVGPMLGCVGPAS